MNTLIASTKHNQKETLSFLLEQHIELKKLIDALFSKAWNTNSIEPLLEIRSLNSSCISKYNDLIINDEVVIDKLSVTGFSILNDYNSGLDLYEINEKLAKMIPVYRKAIKNIHLSSFVRMLVSINMEKLLLAKENLLHPVQDVLDAMSA